ncbi:otoconin-90-like, partial [Cyprinodon tularosa]|uniref:otoconin-90-like n=1 Tax=Cyprinodon tularosa TaxID=77115 RepID=UPI0018E28EA2
MFLLWISMLVAAFSGLSGSSLVCPNPEDSSQNAAHVIDCLGPRFTWLNAVFDNFPLLLSFVSKLRCTSGVCPRDLEDYGCSCKYVASGNPVDPLDTCCAIHRQCYQDAAPCRQQLPPPPYNFSCSAANSSCEFDDLCQQRFCECDQAAIHCVTQSPFNSTLRGLAESFCSAGAVTDVLTAANDSAAHQLPHSSLLSAEELEEGAGEGNQEETKHHSLIFRDLNEEAGEWEDVAEDQTTQSPAELSPDPVQLLHKEQTRNEASAPPSLSGLYYGTKIPPADSASSVLTTTAQRTSPLDKGLDSFESTAQVSPKMEQEEEEEEEAYEDS